jgi:hypothetical protein
MVTKPAKGRFAIVSSQNAFSMSVIENAAKIIAGQFKFPIECVVSDSGADAMSASAKLKELNLDLAIFLVDGESIPISLVAMEERWAIINAAKVADIDTDDAEKSHRLRKELSRVCKALFCGASLEPNSVAVRTGKDLGAMKTEPIDAHSLMSIVRGLPSFGLVAPRTAPYYRACYEGWAPAPTNDFQKAVWDEVHAVPSDPMKIEFDPKKGR